MVEISNIDAIIELILREARTRVRNDLAYGIHEVMTELSERTHKIWVSLNEEERGKIEDEEKG